MFLYPSGVEEKPVGFGASGVGYQFGCHAYFGISIGEHAAMEVLRLLTLVISSGRAFPMGRPW